MKEGQPQAIHLKDYKVPPFLIETTDLHVELNEDETFVTATLRFTRNPDAENEKDLMLDGGKDLDTRLVEIDGRELLSNEYAIDDQSLTLFGVPDSFELKTKVAIKPQENTALEGLYRSGDMFCTQCEAEGFRNITWYLDRPDVMSVYRTTIDAEKKNYPILLSNGNAVARGEEGDRHWVTWEDPFKKPAYLFALVAGNLEFIEGTFETMSGRSITLQIFTESHNIDKVDYAMDALKRSMRWDEEVYGREYDLDIFMIVAVESFNMGAMENKGLNIFNTSCVLARPDTTTDAGYERVEAVVAHEYFHNWSGNRVTCRDWFQLSLKEGFTVFRDQSFSEDMGSETVCRVDQVQMLRAAQFPEDAGPMSHPIRPDSYIEINNFYTATVYEKGAEVVRMYHTLLGEERFRKGSDLYFERHDGQAVTTEEFTLAMEEANDADLGQFRHWYSQSGTPQVTVTGEYDSDAKTFTLDVEQFCPPTPGQPEKAAYHMPLAVGLLDSNGDDIAFTAEERDLATVRKDGEYTAVLHLREPKQTFVLGDVSEEPVPSLLRGFSAPVKLTYQYDRDQLMFLMKHDSDGFNRWEAGQRLAIDVIQEVVGQIQAGIEPMVDERIVRAFEHVLNEAVERNDDDGLDKAMIALMLALPSEQYLGELSEIVDVDSIHAAREEVRGAIARQLSGLFLSVYKLNKSEEAYAPEPTDIARRSLKNAALAYLMQPSDTEMVSLCVEQFEGSDNMTDTSAALRLLVNSASAEARDAKEKALTDFYNRWADEALVIDMWFQIQAACPLPNTLERVDALKQHEAYTLKNPNRARALIGPFCNANPVNFHDRSGSGYRYLADQVIELNVINPQVAARMLSPLTRWRRFDPGRQKLMKAELERILAQDDLSPDVFEIVSKSVEQE